MSRIKENYHLVRSNLNNANLDYFDFNEMCFTKERSNGVPLSTIDAVTTWFPDGEYFCNYLDRTDTIKQDYNYAFYIEQYRYLKGIEGPHMYVVWNDITLNAITKITDGRIDLVHEEVYHIFLDIVEELKNPQSALAEMLLTSERPETRLTDVSKSLVKDLSVSSVTGKQPTFYEMVDTFSPYDDFRALYLAYKENEKLKTYPNGYMLRKVEDRD